MKNAPFQFKSFFTWLLLAVLVFLCAFFTNSFFGKAAFALILLLPPLSLLTQFRVRKGLESSFTLPITVPKQEECRGIVALSNSSIFPCRKAALTLQTENALTGESSYDRIFLTLPSRGDASEEFDFSSEHCGRVIFRIEQITLYDWFGFLPLKAAIVPALNATLVTSLNPTIDPALKAAFDPAVKTASDPSANASASVTILPDLFDCDARVQHSYKEEIDADSFTAFKGSSDPSELFSLHPYEAGDPVRHVHWKLSAKREKLILKEISDPVDETLLLYFDKKSSPAQDAAAEAISSIAVSLADRGFPYTIAWSDADGLFTQNITSSEEILEILPQMIKYGENSSSAELPQLLRRFAKVVWFGQTYPFSLENDLPPDTICLLVHENDYSMEPTHSSSPDNDLPIGELLTVTFAPEETAEILAALNL